MLIPNYRAAEAGSAGVNALKIQERYLISLIGIILALVNTGCIACKRDLNIPQTLVLD